MTFDKINRRTHLYVGLTLLPWFLVYGVSSYFFSHHASPATWSLISERPYHLDAIPAEAGFDTTARKMLTDTGLPTTGRFGAFRSGPGRLSVFKDNFLTPTRLTYDEARQTLRVERREFHLPAILTEAHARGGFEKGGFFDFLWATMVDLFSIAVIVWILSGLLMWWRLRRYYFWGGIALGVGLGSFLLFLILL